MRVAVAGQGRPYAARFRRPLIPHTKLTSSRCAGAAVGFNDSAHSSWGAAIVASGGQWHSYTCEWSHQCGVNSWFTNSQVNHAVSNSPLGPYKRTGLVFPPFSTNPTLSQSAGRNGELVMVMGMATSNGIGRMPSHECTGCTDGSSTNRSCRASRPPFFTNIATSKTPEGPWNVSNILGSRGWGFNFALVINDDLSAVGVTRLGFVNSSRYDDPKAWQNPMKQSIPFTNEELAAGEDP